jgi:hypothetical protein
MEATGIYTVPVYHALIEQGPCEQVLVCNAVHVKNVPDRKTDAVDAMVSRIIERPVARQLHSRAENQSGARCHTVSQEDRRSAHLETAMTGLGIPKTPGSSWTRWLLDCHSIGSGDDRGPHRRGTPPRSARRSGPGPDAVEEIVAVGRSILVIVWHLLSDPEARLHDLGPDFYDTRTGPERKKRNHIRQLEALGYKVTLEPAA